MICGFLVSEPSFAGALWAFCGPGNHSRLVSRPSWPLSIAPVKLRPSIRHCPSTANQARTVSAVTQGAQGFGAAQLALPTMAGWDKARYSGARHTHHPVMLIVCHDYRRPRLMCRLSITIYMAACTKSPPYSNLSALVSNGTSYAAITRMGRSVGDPFAVRIRALTAPSCGPPCAN